MPKVEPAKIWSLNYRLLSAVITQVSAEIASLGLEAKELFMLAELDDHPYPAELSSCLSMPKPTVSVYVKRLEAAGFVRREIDAEDLRRHKLLLTPAGRKVMTQGLARLSDAFGERLARLSAREQLELKELLEKLS
ncbi:MAG TPA: MarR family transcriptional regulator [Polyangiales bacterium]|nr:MarR family transcriptional regulator [Polyangiales bacterium]